MQDIIAKGFARVNESVAPEFLQDSELASLTNGVLDSKQGVAVKRGGFVRFNTNATSGDIKSLHDVVDDAGTDFLLASNSTLLQKTSGGAFSSVKTGLTTGLKTRIQAIGNGRYIVSNGTDSPFIIQGTAFADTFDLGLLKPNTSAVTGSQNNSATGSLDAESIYIYILVNQSDDGTLSAPSRPFTYNDRSSGFRSTSATQKMLRFDNLPSPSADSRVSSVRVYRTVGIPETGSSYAGARTFYYLKTISITATYFTDEQADSELDTSQSIEFFAMPLTFKYMAMQYDRVFYASPKLTNKCYIEPAYANRSGAPPAGYNDGYAMRATTPGTVVNGLDDGALYQWRVVFTDIYGNQSDPLDSETYTTPGSPGTNTTDVYVVNLPITDIISTLPLQKRELYRTEGDGSTFYKLSDLNLAQADFHDIYADGSLLGQYTAQTTTTYPSSVAFSEIGLPSNIPDGNLIDVFPDDGDIITGIVDDTDGVLVFKRYSICKIYTAGSPQNWRVIKIIANIGCTEPETLYKNGNEYFFICNKQAYIYRAGQVQEIGEIFKNTLATVTTWNSISYDPVRKWYVLGVVITATHFVLVYDLKLNTWYKFSITKADAIGYKRYGTGANTLLVGDGTYVIKYDTTVTADNQAGSTTQYQMTLATKTYVVPEGIGKIRLRKYWANYLKTASQDITSTISDPDSADNVSASDTTGSGSKNYEVVTDAMISGGTLKVARKVNFTLTGVGLEQLYGLKLQYNPINRGSRG